MYSYINLFLIFVKYKINNPQIQITLLTCNCI